MDKKIKVLYFAMVELDVPEGPAVHTLNLVKGFKEMGARILLLCPRPRKSYQNPDLQEYIYIPFRGFSIPQLMLFDFLSFFYLLYAFLAFRPNVFLARESEGNLSVLFVTWIFRVPLIVDVNGPFDMDFIALEEFHAEFPSFSRIHPFKRWVISIWRKVWSSLMLKSARGLTSNAEFWRDSVCH